MGDGIGAVVNNFSWSSSFYFREGVGEKWVWKLESSGVYSVKSPYSTIMERHQGSVDIFINHLWNKIVPLKITAFSWKESQDRIPTKENLIFRGIIPDSFILCNGCMHADESTKHFF